MGERSSAWVQAGFSSRPPVFDKLEVQGVQHGTTSAKLLLLNKKKIAYCRMCVGMTFALAELNAIFTSVLTRYTIHLADPAMPEPEMIYEAGVYQPKEHFKFIFKTRRVLAEYPITTAVYYTLFVLGFRET